MWYILPIGWLVYHLPPTRGTRNNYWWNVPEKQILYIYIWRWFVYYRLSCYFWYPRDWCLTPPEKKKTQIHQTLLKTLKPIKRVLFLPENWKGRFPNCGRKLLPRGWRRQPAGNHKKQQSTVSPASVPWCSAFTTVYNMATCAPSHSKPKNRSLDGFDKNISTTQKMVCTSENESFTNQTTLGLI